MNSLKLIIPPIIVFIAFAIAMYGLARLLPTGHFDFFGRQSLIFCVAGLGFLVAGIALAQFYIKKTSIDPHSPQKASVLVTNGIYAVSRNPMYLALLLLLIAFGLYLENAFNSLLIGGFVWCIERYQIRPEEAVLEQKFGTAYQKYSNMVRRWF